MSYRIKVPPKTLQVDETHLLGGMDRLSVSFQRYRVAVISGLIAILLAVGIVGGVLWLDARNTERANELYRQATAAFADRPVDQAAKADANLARAIELYTQVIDQYPRTPAAELALFGLGNALADKKDFAGAISAYQRYIAAYGGNKPLLGMVYQRLAYTYLLKGDTDQAVKAFSAALEVPGALNADQSMFELGKLEEAQSRPEGALARYQELMKGYPNSPFAGEAAVRIKALEAKKNPPELPPSLVPQQTPGGIPVPPPPTGK
jgi:outer membrane protein assembly factor BamD (BamD/ComL family)